MKKWFEKNLKNLIIGAFIVPILLVAIVSIAHVTEFYGISNPMSWAMYLSVGIEIAAISALAAVSVKMGRFVYFPFIVVTFIQLLGNFYFAFTYIDQTSKAFLAWVDMVSTFFETMGVEPTDLLAHKRILAFISGGLLPLISLTFAHMLVVFMDKVSIMKQEEDKKEQPQIIQPDLHDEKLYEISKIIGAKEREDYENNRPKNFPNLEEIEKVLIKKQPISDTIVDTLSEKKPEEESVEVNFVISPEEKIEEQEEQKKIKRLVYQKSNG